MRVGPAPLTPLFPIHPDRSEVYPKALGDVFVGKPYLKLPEVKAVAAKPPPSKPQPTQDEALEGGLKTLQARKEGPEGALGPPKETLVLTKGAKEEGKGGKPIGGILDFKA